MREDFTENGFQWFHDAELLAAGDKEKSNAMTIGWGGIGTLWGRTALTVYVAEKRYTKEFLDKTEYFTVMAFDVENSKVLNYMGTKILLSTLPAFAQEENGFKKFNVREDFTENGFQWFRDAELLAAGDKEKSNAMTIGWGGI